MKPRLSIVIPVYQEAATLANALRELAPLREQGVEVIVVDGQSRDHTAGQAEGLSDHIVPSLRGRARQMNAGAARAQADRLLFLHADTRLPADALPAIEAALGDRGEAWGRFDVRIDSGSVVLRGVAWMMNQRSRLTGIATGDQAIFVTRDAFRAVNGFPDQELMEDIEISAQLRRIRRPACLRQTVVTSARRWERHGVWRTILLMWRLRLLYWLGVAPDRLARSYRRSSRG